MQSCCGRSIQCLERRRCSLCDAITSWERPCHYRGSHEPYLQGTVIRGSRIHRSHNFPALLSSIVFFGPTDRYATLQDAESWRSSRSLSVIAAALFHLSQHVFGLNLRSVLPKNHRRALSFPERIVGSGIIVQYVGWIHPYVDVSYFVPCPAAVSRLIDWNLPTTGRSTVRVAHVNSLAINRSHGETRPRRS